MPMEGCHGMTRAYLSLSIADTSSHRRQSPHHCDSVVTTVVFPNRWAMAWCSPVFKYDGGIIFCRIGAVLAHYLLLLW